MAGASHFGRHRSLEPGAVAVEFLHQEDYKKIQKEIIISGKATIQEANDSEPEVIARSDLRKRINPVRMLPTGNVYHTHEKCPHYKSGRQVHKCLKCSGYEGSM